MAAAADAAPHRPAAPWRRAGISQRQPNPGRLFAAGVFSAGTELLTGGSRLRLSQMMPMSAVGGTFTNSPTVTLLASYRGRFRSHVSGTDAACRFVRAHGGGIHLAGTGARAGPALDRRLRQRASLPERADRGRPGIREVLKPLLELQRTGRLSVQLEVAGQARLGTRDRRRRPRRRARATAAAPLALAPDQTTFPVTYTLCAARPGQIAIRTRSPIEVLDQLAGDVGRPRRRRQRQHLCAEPSTRT